jgi:hypothetical protein
VIFRSVPRLNLIEIEVIVAAIGGHVGIGQESARDEICRVIGESRMRLPPAALNRCDSPRTAVKGGRRFGWWKNIERTTKRQAGVNLAALIVQVTLGSSALVAGAGSFH